MANIETFPIQISVASTWNGTVPQIDSGGAPNQLHQHYVDPYALKAKRGAKRAAILIGNPGTGKSSTINCFLGIVLFNSGASFTGQGITYVLDVREYQGKLWMDTPGLSDVNLRGRAAKAIDQALQLGGDFEMVFAMTLESGRLRPDDLTTMKIVLEACQQVGEDQFAIFVNKSKKAWLKKMGPEERETWIGNLHKACRERGIPTTRFIHFAPLIDDLDEEECKVVQLDAGTMDFFRALPSISIDPKQVSAVNVDDFEAQTEKMVALTQSLANLDEARKKAEMEREQAAAEAKAAALQAAVDRAAKLEAEAQKLAAEAHYETQLRTAAEQLQAQAEKQRKSRDLAEQLWRTTAEQSAQEAVAEAKKQWEKDQLEKMRQGEVAALSSIVSCQDEATGQTYPVETYSAVEEPPLRKVFTIQGEFHYDSQGSLKVYMPAQGYDSTGNLLPGYDVNGNLLPGPPAVYANPPPGNYVPLPAVRSLPNGNYVLDSNAWWMTPPDPQQHGTMNRGGQGDPAQEYDPRTLVFYDGVLGCYYYRDRIFQTEIGDLVFEFQGDGSIIVEGVEGYPGRPPPL